MADTKMMILDLDLPIQKYTMESSNLIKNDGVMARDKWPHTTYPHHTCQYEYL